MGGGEDRDSGTGMCMGNVEAMMQHCREEDRVMEMQWGMGVDNVDAMM